MSSLNLRLAAWNAAAKPTKSRVTATTAFKDGIACGHADGKIWLYSITAPGTQQSSANKANGSAGFQIHPKCMLSAHRAPIALMKSAKINSPSAEGSEDTVISISDDGDIVVWSTTDGRCISRVRTPLQDIHPTSATLQTIEYQSAAEDLLFVFGEGRTARILSYPSLEIVYDWHLPHAEWITSQTVRKRKDHFRSELITCTGDGTVRIWSYDEFALVQQDVFSRSVSPTMANIADIGASTNTAGSGSESAYSDGDGGSEAAFGGSRNSPMFQLESKFDSFLDEEDSIKSLAINPFNDDEFLAISSKMVRLFASRQNELHELLRWKTQRTTSAPYTGGGFLTKADIVFWDSVGNIFSVCSSFSVQGGSAGMHVTRSQHAELIESSPEYTVSRLVSVPTDASSAFSKAAERDGGLVDVLITYTSSLNEHTLAIVLPTPLSSVSGSANRPHMNLEDASSKPKSWLGRSALFAMNSLWDGWIESVCAKRATTSALVSRSGDIVLGHSDGCIRILSPTSLMINPQSEKDSSSDSLIGPAFELSGHDQAVNVLYEWQASSAAECVLCKKEQTVVSDDLNGQQPHEPGKCKCQKLSNLLVSASKDLTMRIWNMATKECLCVLPTQSAPVVHISSVLPAKRISWRETERHKTLFGLLDSMLLVIGSENSTTLISMHTLDRVHVTAPYHSQPVRITVCSEPCGLELGYADGSKRMLSLARLLAEDSDESSYTAEAEEHEAVTSVICSNSLLTSAAGARFTNDGYSSADTSGSHWASVFLLSPGGPRFSRGSSGSDSTPAALVLELEIMQLQSATAKIVPDGADMDTMRMLLKQENEALCERDSHYYSGGGLRPLHTSLMLLSVLCTWGINDGLDSIKQKLFGMRQPLSNVSLSVSNKQRDVHTVLFPDTKHRCASWCVSPLLNAQRMLAILILSRSVLQVARCAPGAVDSEGLYALTIVCVIGTDFPSLLPLTARNIAATMLQALITMNRAVVRARMVAIELLSRGFATFKPYLDCQFVIQRLLSIMMSVSEDGHAASPGDGVGSGVGRAAVAAMPVSIGVGGGNSRDNDENMMGLGIRRTMSGASMPALARSGHGTSAPGSRRPSHARHPGESAAKIESGETGAPRPIPASGIRQSDQENGSLATTPTNTLSSVARAAMTSHAWRAQGMGAAAGRLQKPEDGADGDAEQYSDNGLSTAGIAEYNSNGQGNEEAEGDSDGQYRRRPYTSAHGHTRYHARSRRHPKEESRSRQLSAGERGGSTVSFNLIVLAKSALLRICAADTSVVSSTICGILQDSEGALQQRRGALQLVGLVVQKYPTHMYPHLERIVAAIVQAIEPKRATLRRELIGAAGAALQGLVRAYSCVSFHPESQCLVVGCIDGQCTAYDLRTATRMAVFDGQAASPVAAVAISPKGDRVASFTLGDGMLNIWDPSPSALAMFARSLFWSTATSDEGGGKESQSSGSVQASKTMKIPAGFLDHADELPISSVIAAAKLTWTSDRTVRLQVQEATFSLSV
ncbi:hypothetical protein GGI25_002684 [Coemansia spiralis]|uniref:Uncharacterized protein n=1 Tax=Coemansia spiralis TaxID=417178 RepID=A0A9W8KZ46_9FUNG|nr:hypothetical protein GGI25_002684 [Coemansia spiralis]